MVALVKVVVTDQQLDESALGKVIDSAYEPGHVVLVAFQNEWNSWNQ